MNSTHNWTTDDCIPDGGTAYGEGFCISWQRGSLEKGRNGAFLIEVLEACKSQLMFYQNSKFPCEENQIALQHLEKCIAALESRIARRQMEGKLGTHIE